MPTYNYKCDKCEFINEYCTHIPSLKAPDICPKCKEGKMTQLFTIEGQSFDIIGWCYMNEYGKHAWKKNLSVEDQSKVLDGTLDPY